MAKIPKKVTVDAELLSTSQTKVVLWWISAAY